MVDASCDFGPCRNLCMILHPMASTHTNAGTSLSSRSCFSFCLLIVSYIVLLFRNHFSRLPCVIGHIIFSASIHSHCVICAFQNITYCLIIMPLMNLFASNVCLWYTPKTSKRPHNFVFFHSFTPFIHSFRWPLSLCLLNSLSSRIIVSFLVCVVVVSFFFVLFFHSRRYFGV